MNSFPLQILYINKCQLEPWKRYLDIATLFISSVLSRSNPDKKFYYFIVSLPFYCHLNQ